MCEDIHSPKLLICQPPAKTATVQHESLAVVVSEQLCATWSVLTRGSDAFSFFFFFLNTPRLFNMQITATSLNPTASFGNQAPLSHHRWRASQLCCRVRWGTNVSVSVRGRERERELQRKGLNESSGEEKRKKGRGERAGRQGTGRNVVAACQLLIRALVCPLWVRKRDWQCKCSHHHVHAHRRAHLSLWMSALMPGTSQQIKDKTCTLQPPTTKPSITGLPLKSSVQTNTWKKQNTLLFLHMCVFYWTIA